MGDNTVKSFGFQTKKSKTTMVEAWLKCTSCGSRREEVVTYDDRIGRIIGSSPCQATLPGSILHCGGGLTAFSASDGRDLGIVLSSSQLADLGRLEADSLLQSSAADQLTPGPPWDDGANVGEFVERDQRLSAVNGTSAVSAVRWAGGNPGVVGAWLAAPGRFRERRGRIIRVDDGKVILVGTADGFWCLSVEVGDWLFEGFDGDLHVLSGETFSQLYTRYDAGAAAVARVVERIDDMVGSILERPKHWGGDLAAECQVISLLEVRGFAAGLHRSPRQTGAPDRQRVSDEFHRFIRSELRDRATVHPLSTQLARLGRSGEFGDLMRKFAAQCKVLVEKVADSPDSPARASRDALGPVTDQLPPVPRPDQIPVWENVISDFRIRYEDHLDGITDEITGSEDEDKRVAWQVISDMRERDQVGRSRYGTPLTANNGRDQLVDAYQELLDAAVYLRAAWLEGSQTSKTYFRVLDDLLCIRHMIDERCRSMIKETP